MTWPSDAQAPLPRLLAGRRGGQDRNHPADGPLARSYAGRPRSVHRGVREAGRVVRQPSAHHDPLHRGRRGVMRMRVLAGGDCALVLLRQLPCTLADAPILTFRGSTCTASMVLPQPSLSDPGPASCRMTWVPAWPRRRVACSRAKITATQRSFVVRVVACAARAGRGARITACVLRAYVARRWRTVFNTL